MRSLLKPTGNLKKIIGVEANRIIEQCVDKNFKLVPVALHRMGFGLKRIERLTEIYNEVMAEYKQHDRDGVFDVMLEREYKEFDLNPEHYASPHVPYKERQRRIHAKNKPVSVVEAEEMRRKMIAVKEYLENDERADDKA
jgi:hypothetical protein